MGTTKKTVVYLTALVGVFALTFLAGRALIPEETVSKWIDESDSVGHKTHQSAKPLASGGDVGGLSIEQDGYTLAPITAPRQVGEEGLLSFRITEVDGQPLKDFATNHEKQLHLIVVRADGADYSHAHPRLNRSSGEWSIPWSWKRAGTYRLYADFLPGATGDDSGVTLTRNFEVAGEFQPETLEPTRTDQVGEFKVALSGELKVGVDSNLTAEVTQSGEPVTTLQPYLGAFGHLVALREGDLAYLHVHAEGDHSHHAENAGPEISFVTRAPSSGRYLMYLDFKVDDQVHTAKFVVEAR